MNDQILQLLDSGAKKLLKIACDNDKTHRLFNNKLFSTALQALSRLHKLCVNENKDEILDWLRIPAQVEKIFFVHLTAAFVRSIQTDEISDYDHFVMISSAETLSEIMWQDKIRIDIPGPNFQECIEEYGFQEIAVILQVFIKNYIGNILQYLFEAGKIRVANPSLPPETEVDLKEKDAVAMSNFVFLNISLGESFESNAKLIVDKLNFAQNLILTK